MVVERSSDGRSFQDLGMVSGMGTTSKPQQYQFWDRKPFSGLNYYRLRQVDFDGKATLHEVINIRLGDQIGTISVTPNLVTTVAAVQWSQPLKEEAQLLVLNAFGQVLRSQLMEKGTASAEVAVEDLPAGQYFLKLEGRGLSQIVRFMKD